MMEESDRDSVWELLGQASDALDDDSVLECHGFLKQARRSLDRLADADQDLEYEYYLLAGEVCFASGNYVGSKRQCDVAREYRPDDPDGIFLQARACFHSWEFEESRKLLGSPLLPSSPSVTYYRGLLAEFSGDPEAAESFYAQAEKEDPEVFCRPSRHPPDQVEAMLQEVLAELPPDVQEAMEGVSVSLQPLPDPETHASPDTDPMILGLYSGTPLTEGNSFELSMDVSRIWVFQSNVERVARNAEELMHELRTTLLHEIGHHLGWNEDDLEERGLD